MTGLVENIKHIQLIIKINFMLNLRHPRLSLRHLNLPCEQRQKQITLSRILNANSDWLAQPRSRFTNSAPLTFTKCRFCTLFKSKSQTLIGLCGRAFQYTIRYHVLVVVQLSSVTNKMDPQTCAPNKVSNQFVHPRHLIRIFVVSTEKLCILGYPKRAQRRF